MFWNTVGSFFYQGCMWLLTVLVVRLSDDYQNSGALAFAMTVGNVFFMMATYNLRTYQVSDVKNEYSPSNYIAIRIFTVLAAIAICVPYSIAISPSEETFLVIFFFLLFKSDEAFVNVLYGIDQQKLRLDISGISQVIRGFTCIIAFGALLVLTNSLQAALLAMFISCLLVTIFFDLPKTRNLTQGLMPHIQPSRCRTLLIKCLPATLGIVISNFIVSTARQLFGLGYGESALGIYASVAAPCVVVQVMIQNIYTPMLGPIADQRCSGKISHAHRTSRLLFLGTTVGCALLSLIIFLLSEPLLYFIYGSDLANNYSYLVPGVLAVSSLSVLLCLLTDLLIVFKGLKATLIMNVVAFAAMIASAKPLMDAFYMNGVSFTLCLAYSVAIVIGLAFLYYYSRNKNSQIGNSPSQ